MLALIVGSIPVLNYFVCLLDGVWRHFQQYFNYIVAVSFIGAGIQRTRRKPNRPVSQVTDKHYHIMLYTSPWSRFKLTTSVVIGTDYIGSCKSKYYTITSGTDPRCKISCIKLCKYNIIKAILNGMTSICLRKRKLSFTLNPFRRVT